MSRFFTPQTIKFNANDPAHALTVMDACFSQTAKFDCVIIMQYIAANETDNKTFDHHEIAYYLDHLAGKGIIKRTYFQNSEFTTYDL